jgi:hypothetical protein
MESTTATLFEKIQSLPVEQLPAVENFVDRLLALSAQQQSDVSLMPAAESFLVSHWEHSENAVYDEIVLAQDWLKPEEDDAWQDL